MKNGRWEITENELFIMEIIMEEAKNMNTKIFVNLPVKNLNKSKDFLLNLVLFSIPSLPMKMPLEFINLRFD